MKAAPAANSFKLPGFRVPAFVAEAPGLFGGALLSLGVIGAVLANATMTQDATHPSPLFSPRSTVAIAPIEDAADPVKKVTTAKVSAKPSQATTEILREVQTALSVRGYYEGKLDGVYGSRTKAAIQSFQADHSLPQDGQASVRLLTQVLMSASASPSTVPVPKANTLATKKPVVETAKVEEDAADGMVARIQAGLRKYGYDDLVVDGRMGQQTATAIQRFQLDFGMKITGEPSQGVLDKLRDVGAAQQG